MDPLAPGNEDDYFLFVNSDDEIEFFNAASDRSHTPDQDAVRYNSDDHNNNNMGPGNPAAAEVVDLTELENIPDIDVPPDRARSPFELDPVDALSDAECLQIILDILPDIQVNHVLGLLQDQAHSPEGCQRVIAQILDAGSYPKETDINHDRKRKRENDDDDDDATPFQRGQEAINDAAYRMNS